MIRSVLPAVALLATLSACNGEAGSSAPAASEALPTVAAPQGAKWSETVVKTDRGGYLMGNPAAPVKLVEYASITCSHCRDFKAQAFPELKAMVDSGRLSFELRNFLLNPYDIPITLLTRCGDPATYFPLTEQFYDGQTEILTAAQQVPPAQVEAAIKQPEATRYAALAQAMNILPFFQQRGISADQARACLTDQAKVKELVALTELGAQQDQVQGTPSFTLNGAKYEFQGWPAMKTRLMEAGVR